MNGGARTHPPTGSSSQGLKVPWRWLAIAGEVPALLMVLLLLFMPRSPRRLLSLGRVEQAEKALRFLRGNNYDTTAEISAIQVEKFRLDGLFLFLRLKLNSVEAMLAFFLSLSLVVQHQRTRESDLVPAGHAHFLPANHHIGADALSAADDGHHTHSGLPGDNLF